MTNLSDLARQAGIVQDAEAFEPTYVCNEGQLARFAALVRAETVADVVVALDSIERFSLDRKAPGMFKHHGGSWVKAEAGIAAVRALGAREG